MTPAQYNAALRAIGIATQREAAAFLCVSLRTAHGYANGAPVPPLTAKLLRLMVRLCLNARDVR